LLVLCVVSFVVCAPLEVQIQLSSETYVRGEEVFVDWSVANQQDEPLRLLNWNTPLEGEWNSKMFFVQHVGSDNFAEYQGRVYKRAEPSENDFSLLVSSAPKSGRLSLSEGYNFYEAGVYKVRMQFNVEVNGNLHFVQSNTVLLRVLSEDLEADRITTGSRAFGSRVSYNGCSSSEQSTVKTAISNAVTASQNAENYMASSCTSEYVTWFGTYSSSNWNTIKSDFTNINNKLASNNFGIDCTCNQPGTYAYVYPSDPSHTIFLCPVFWSASSNKYTYNSQPGTLTHEMSHFNDIAGTEDYQYGVTGCMNLAKSNPSRAVNNADSHEYFQESQPTC